MPCASIAYAIALRQLTSLIADHVVVRTEGADARGREDVEGRDLIEAALLGRVEPDGDVEVTGLELGDRLVAQEALDEDLLDLRGALEVVRVRLELGVLVGLVADELVGAGADRRGGRERDRLDGLGIGRLEEVLRHDRRLGVGQVAGVVRVRRLERQRDRVVVDDVDALGLAGARVDDGLRALDRLPRGAREADRRDQRAVDRELDVLGRERLAVMPVDALAQMERPGQAVRGDFPRLGDVRSRRPRQRRPRPSRGPSGC